MAAQGDYLERLLEIPPRAELHKARRDHLDRIPYPRDTNGTDAVQRRGNRVGVEGVIHIQVEVQTARRQTENLREPEVDLVQPVAP